MTTTRSKAATATNANKSQIDSTTCPDWIDPRHWQEWVTESAVDPQIVSQAIRSVGTFLSKSRVAALLGRSHSQKWMAAGWMVRGVDPRTNELADCYQFKPDNPRLNSEKKAIKYESATPEDPPTAAGAVDDFAYVTQALYLPCVQWPSAIKDNSPIWITEGAKKAGAIISQSRAAIALFGVWNGQRAGRLIPELELIATPGRRLYLAFDADVYTKSSVRQALTRLSALLQERGCLVSVVGWDEENKGIDDHLVTIDPADRRDAIAQLEASAQTWQEWKKTAPEPTRSRFNDRNTPGLLLEEVDQLLDRGLSGASLTAAVIDTAVRLNVQARVVSQLLDERLSEREREEDRDRVLGEIERQKIARNAKLDLFRVLPEPLAAAITHLANWLNLRPESYAFTLLATVSSLHKNGSKLRLLDATDYDITPALYCGIVAPPSQRKTPVVKAIATKPLQRLHQTASEVYDTQLEEWVAQCLTAKKDGAPEPKEPNRRLYHFTNTTGEAIMRQAGRQIDHGLLYLCDELKSLFGNANSYRSGKGSDMEDLLRYYDGDGGKVLRADGLRDDVATFNFGIVGAIQPEVLRSLMGDGSDANGQWSRFMFVSQPIAPNLITSDGGGVNMTALLEHAYRRIDNLPEMHYKLSPAAKARWLQRRNEYEQARCTESRPALSSYYGKSDGRIGKIAMNLHVLWWAMNGDRMTLPSETIDVGTIEAAIALTDFSISQIESIYSDLEPTDGTNCPHLTKICEHLDRKGQLKPRDVYAGFGRRFPYGKAPKSQAAVSWFREIEALGLARVITTGSTVTLTKLTEEEKQKVSSLSSLSSNLPNPYTASLGHDDNGWHHPVIIPDPVITPTPKNDDNDDSAPESVINPQTQTENEVQPNDDNDDNDDSLKVDLENSGDGFVVDATEVVTPIAISEAAGIKHRGITYTWLIVKIEGGQYYLRLAGTSTRKKLAIDHVDSEHLIYPKS